ncbi:MAG: hypothetical protein ABIQ89_04240 [Candidatus Saccharimonadales bacterium]
MADEKEPIIYPGDETRGETIERVNNFFRDSEIVKVRGTGDEPGPLNVKFTRISETLDTETHQQKTATQEDINV